MTERAGKWRPYCATGIAVVLAVAYGCSAGGDAPEAGASDAGASEAGAFPETRQPAAADSAAPVSGPATMSTGDAARDAADPPVMPPPDDDDTGQPWTVQDTRVDRDGAGLAVLLDVRSARHDAFDRVVLDFGDDAVPGYSVAYIDRPVRQCGSGHTVPVAGDGWLQIEVTPAHAHTDAGRPTITERSRRPGLANVQQLELTCDFEGHVVWVAGVASPAPYRVFELRSPARLIIDVRHTND